MDTTTYGAQVGQEVPDTLNTLPDAAVLQPVPDNFGATAVPVETVDPQAVDQVIPEATNAVAPVEQIAPVAPVTESTVTYTQAPPSVQLESPAPIAPMPPVSTVPSIDTIMPKPAEAVDFTHPVPPVAAPVVPVAPVVVSEAPTVIPIHKETAVTQVEQIVASAEQPKAEEAKKEDHPRKEKPVHTTTSTTTKAHSNTQTITHVHEVSREPVVIRPQAEEPQVQAPETISLADIDSAKLPDAATLVERLVGLHGGNA